jgi:hypothetical protein
LLKASSPEWLELDQIGVRFCRSLDPSILSPGQQSRREGTTRVGSFADHYRRDPLLVDGDIIEVAEAILKTFEGGQKLFLALGRTLDAPLPANRVPKNSTA